MKKHMIGPSSDVMTTEEVREAVRKERCWLKKNNAVSEVTGGPVEDMEGVPLPADLHQGTPPTEKDLKNASRDL